MTHPTSRRDFLKAAALATAAVPVGIAVSSSAKDNLKWQLESDFFGVAFDVASGEFHVRRRDGSELITGARVCVRTSKGARFSTDTDYTRSLQSGSVDTKWIAGKQLVVR